MDNKIIIIKKILFSNKKRIINTNKIIVLNLNCLFKKNI